MSFSQYHQPQLVYMQERGKKRQIKMMDRTSFGRNTLAHLIWITSLTSGLLRLPTESFHFTNDRSTAHRTQITVLMTSNRRLGWATKQLTSPLISCWQTFARMLIRKPKGKQMYNSDFLYLNGWLHFNCTYITEMICFLRHLCLLISLGAVLVMHFVCDMRCGMGSFSSRLNLVSSVFSILFRIYVLGWASLLEFISNRVS